MISKTASPLFQLIADHPILDLVNTLDWRFRKHGEAPKEPVEGLQSYSDLLTFVEKSKLWTAKHSRMLQENISPAAGGRVLQQVRHLREACAEILYAAADGSQQPPAAHRTLTRMFKAALEQQELVWNGSHLAWEWPEMAPAAELPLWLLSLSAANLMISPEIGRVRACENPECRWLFYDGSKNGARRWCSMSLCGNRMKARRFKAQQRGQRRR